MTTATRQLVTPAVWSQAMASTRTARAGHATDLVALANDAASGHPAQRITVARNTGGTIVAIMHRDTVARYVTLGLTISWRSATASSDGVTVSLSVSDGTTTVSPPSSGIPFGWDGSVSYTSSAGTLRAASMGHARAVLDLEDSAFAALSTSVPWRFTFTVVCDPGVSCESITAREVPRFLVDDSRAWGEVPGHYLPHAPITSRLSRAQATVETAYDTVRRTYLHLAVPRASAWSTSATSYAAIPGTLSESVGVPTVFRVHPRRISGNPAVLFGPHYRTSSSGAASLRLHSAGTGAAYAIALPATSGAWATALTGAGSLFDADEDALWVDAQVASGTLEIATLWVADDPA